MEDLLQFKRNATFLGLCGEYKKKWDACGDKRALVGMALDSNGVEFMADSIAFGWGLSRDFLLKEFGEYANGAYQCHERGYTSEMYIGARGELTARSTILLVAYCDDLRIEVPERFACRVYVCGGSKVEIRNLGATELFVYGDGNAIEQTIRGGVATRTDIKESQWRK